MFGDVHIDVVGGLPAFATNALDHVPRGLPALLPGDNLDQAVAKCQVSANLFNAMHAFHPLVTCANTLPV